MWTFNLATPDFGEQHNCAEPNAKAHISWQPNPISDVQKIYTRTRRLPSLGISNSEIRERGLGEGRFGCDGITPAIGGDWVLTQCVWLPDGEDTLVGVNAGRGPSAHRDGNNDRYRTVARRGL